MIRQRNPDQFGVPTEFRIDIQEYYDVLIVPRRNAPVFREVNGAVVTTALRFALLPSWSKEPKVKFATHNARLESIDEKPTWKTVFVKRHCLVPMTEFYEPIYEGEYGGNMVAFSEKSGAALFAAGVWDEWVNRETGEVIQSFAIITHDPPPFIAGIGHDRCPVFLNQESAKEWLHSQGAPARELKDFLLGSRHTPDFQVEIQRALK